MKNRRMLIMLDGAKDRSSTESSIWGQSVETAVYPRVQVQSGVVVKNPKLVLGYPSLPRSDAVSAHYVEIQNPPSTLPTRSKHFSNAAASGNGTEGGAPNSTSGSNQAGGRPSIRTVGDYFRTQRGIIVSTAKKERMEREEQQAATSGTLKTALEAWSVCFSNSLGFSVH
jgi:hypothetical protein